MSNYNLSDDVQDSFTFEMRGKKFEMRYPKTSEVEEVQKISNELDELDKKEGEIDKKAVKKLNDKLENYLYSFIQPREHEVSIQDALKDENIKVMRNFNKMIKAELAIS